PARGRDAELVQHLGLPLLGQRGWREDHYGATRAVFLVRQQAKRQCRRCQRQRLAETYLVSKQQARIAMQTRVAQNLGQEALLPRLKLLALAIERGFDQRRGREVLVLVDLVKDHLAAITASAHLTNHRLRQRLGRIPEELKLVLDPGHTLRRFILPQNLVMALPAAAGLVHRTDEAEPAAIGQGDDTRLAMHEAADLVRRHPHGLAVFLQEGIQPPVAVAVQQRFGLQSPLVPAAEHLALAQLGDFELVRMNIDVADDPHLGNTFQHFTGHLEQGAGEIARDALVAARPSEVPHQEAGIEPVDARGEAPDRHPRASYAPNRRFLSRALSTSAAVRTSSSDDLRSMKASMSASKGRTSRKSAISWRI